MLHKKHLILALSAAFFMLAACSNSNGTSSDSTLTAADFAARMKQVPAAQVLDVRTPGEFEKGHLEHAMNIDWNGSSFQRETATLDKSKPVFVYCLSGGRSAAAAEQLRADGFKEVYELKGGLMKWRAAGLSETTENEATASNQGLTLEQFNRLAASAPMVLIDFYADWCVPCKKMKPYLDEISRDMAGEVLVIRINADDNTALCRELHVDALPVLQLYRQGSVSWTHEGYIGKEEVIGKIREY